MSTPEHRRGMTEAQWLACADPMRMTKMFRGAVVARKYCLLTCAYLLGTPGGFRNEHARRVVEIVRDAAFRACTHKELREATTAAVRRLLPDCPHGNYYTLWGHFRARGEYGGEGGQIGYFISDCAFKAPTSAEVNSAATACLATVRQDARGSLVPILARLAREHGVNTEACKEAIYAMIPEPARTAARAGAWTTSFMPSRVRDRLHATVARPKVEAASARMADLAREVLGNPFRQTVIEPEWLLWNHGAVRHIAEQIAASRNFADMPILADALEEAGCADAELLRHCREGAHVPGCWALDVVLGRG